MLSPCLNITFPAQNSIMHRALHLAEIIFMTASLLCRSDIIAMCIACAEWKTILHTLLWKDPDLRVMSKVLPHNYGPTSDYNNHKIVRFIISGYIINTEHITCIDHSTRTHYCRVEDLPRALHHRQHHQGQILWWARRATSRRCTITH